MNGEVVSRVPFAAMYWTMPQFVAHLTVNGASLRTGDLLASGTVSGPGEGEHGCLLEMGGPFLADGDEVVLSTPMACSATSAASSSPPNPPAPRRPPSPFWAPPPRCPR